MTAHVVFEPLDPQFPATMSRPVLHGLLREGMNFDGVIISDALEMKAIANHFSVDELVTRGANAGLDLFAACEESPLRARAIDALAAAARRGDVPLERFNDAARRIDALITRYVKPAGPPEARAVLNSPEHQAVVARILQHAPDAAAGQADPTAHRLV
jgi:beta-N-acetylhexosaminidase